MKIECYLSSQTSIPERYKHLDFDGFIDNPSQLIEPCLRNDTGFTFMTYGQSGSGKTHTMNHVLSAFATRFNCVIQISAVEIYNNDLYDLLNKRTKLRMPRQRKTVNAHGIHDFIRVYTLLKHQRITKHTANNAESSRSHMICTLIIKGVVYHFVDLAGFEEHANQESHHINTSLYFLRDCVSKMRRCQTAAVRQSKLTWYLFEAIMNTIVCVCTIIPEQAKKAQSTIEYGLSLKGIRSVPASITNMQREEVRQYAKHTQRLSTFEEQIMKDYLRNPSKQLKSIVHDALNHRKEMIEHMLKNIFG